MPTSWRAARSSASAAAARAGAARAARARASLGARPAAVAAATRKASSATSRSCANWPSKMVARNRFWWVARSEAATAVRLSSSSSSSGAGDKRSRIERGGDDGGCDEKEDDGVGMAVVWVLPAVVGDLGEGEEEEAEDVAAMSLFLASRRRRCDALVLPVRPVHLIVRSSRSAATSMWLKNWAALSSPMMRV